MSKEWIEVAAQIGGKDAFLVVQPHIRHLKEAFASVVDPVSERVQQLTYILRVDDNVRVWNLPLVSNIDLSIKEGYVSVDIAVPASEWKKSAVDLADYIMGAFTAGLHSVLIALKQAGVAINAERLKTNLLYALNSYHGKISARANQQP